MAKKATNPNLPDNCNSCGRWQHCGPRGQFLTPTVWRQGHRLPYNAAESRAPLVFLIGEPDLHDNDTGSLYQSSPHAKMFHEFAARLQVDYAVVSCLMCGPGERTAKNNLCEPKDKQLEACNSFLSQTLEGLSPAVIVAVGKVAAEQMLGSLGTMTLDDAHLHVFQFEQDDIPVLVMPDPRQQFGSGRDIRPQLAETLLEAQRIALGEWQDPHSDIEYCVLDSDISIVQRVSRFQKAVRQNLQERCTREMRLAGFDTEFAVSPDRDETVWFDCTPLISCQVTIFHSEARRYITTAISLLDMTHDQLRNFFIETFGGLTLITSWGKIDFQKIWFETSYRLEDGTLEGGVELYNFIRDWEDIHAIDWLQNQSLKGTGLKSQTMRYFKVPNYSCDLKILEARLSNLLMRPVDGRDLLEHYPYWFWRYACFDSHYTLRIWREHASKLPFAPRDMDVSYNYDNPYQALKRDTITALQIERTGHYIDLEYLQQYWQYCEAQIEKLGQWLNQTPVVVQANLRDSKGNAISELNTKSPDQITAICDYWGWNHIPYTESGKLRAVNKDTLPGLVGKLPPLGDKEEWLPHPHYPAHYYNSVTNEIVTKATAEQQFFTVLWEQRKLRDMISKFITPFHYYAQEGGIARTTYSLTKLEDEFDTALGGSSPVTGRAASTAPNTMGKIKVKEFRNAFIPPRRAKPMVIVQHDYSTLEPLLTAFLADCPSLKQVFLDRVKNPDSMEGDVYWLNVAQRRACSLAQLEPTLSKLVADKGPYKKDRTQSKIVWLAATYGQFPETCANNLGVEYGLAQSWLHSFYDSAPEVLAAEAEIRRKVFEGEIITTVTNRRRTFPLKNRYPYRHEQHRNLLFYQLCQVLRISPYDAEVLRQAVNDAIQGPGGQIGWAACTAMLTRTVKDPRMSEVSVYDEIHDAVGYYAPDDENLHHTVTTLQRVMANPRAVLTEDICKKCGFPDGVPLLLNDVSIGYRGGEMIPMSKWQFK